MVTNDKLMNLGDGKSANNHRNPVLIMTVGRYEYYIIISTFGGWGTVFIAMTLINSWSL